MIAPPAQLVLRFPHDPGCGAADLLPNAGQVDARAWLGTDLEPGQPDSQPDNQPWPLSRLAIWGDPGSGKTHLARAWAERRGGAVLPRAPDGGFPHGFPEGPIAIDTIDTVPSEPALLHLLNAAAEAGHPVLLLSTTAPGRLPVRLPDLASRLRATTAVRITPADERFLGLLLTRLLSDRQLRLPGPLQSWLLARLPRSPGAVRDAVTRLDAAALSTGRTITRPMAAAVLGLCDNLAPDALVASLSPPNVG